MFHVKQSVIERQVAGAGLQVTREQLASLQLAAEWLARLARASGLSGYDSAQEAWERGMTPALAYFNFPEAPRSGALADLGAGSGALGATIAILEGNLQVDLVDRAQKAYTACELLVARLRRSNLRARWQDAGDAAARRYDAVVFRALGPGERALSLAVRVVRANGFIGAYHRAGDRGFTADADHHGLMVVSTVETPVPGLHLTGYRT
ncbi:MAG: RsmG family class I SAM-dependent methyltransferase [Armatimonadota bacterium]